MVPILPTGSEYERNVRFDLRYRCYELADGLTAAKHDIQRAAVPGSVLRLQTDKCSVVSESFISVPSLRIEPSLIDLLDESDSAASVGAAYSDPRADHRHH